MDAHTDGQCPLESEAIRRSLKLIKEAELINADYSLLVYTKGRVLWSMEDYASSILEWDKLIGMSIEKIAEQGFNKNRAGGMQNDARYYKADCLYCLYRNAEAEAQLKEHIAHRRKGQESEFSMKEVRRSLQILEFSPKDASARNHDHTTGYATSAQGHRIEKHLCQLEKQGNVSSIIGYLKRKCNDFPNEYWLKIKLAEYLYNQHDKSCLDYAAAAYGIAPDDMLVVYDYACALSLNGQCTQAIELLQMIQEKGLDYMAYSEHGEGMRWAKRLMNDVNSLMMSIKNN